MIAGATTRTSRLPARYWVAGLVGTVVLVALVATSFLDYLQVSEVAGQFYLLGIPAVGLMAISGYVALRAAASRTNRRQQVLRAIIYLGLSGLVWLLALDIALFTRASGPLLSLKAAAACLPTTALGLWAVRSLDRFQPKPWPLVLLAAAWGAIVATSLVVYANTLLANFAIGHLVPGHGLEAVTAYGAGLFEELAKGVAVLLLYLLLRHHFDGILDGVVYGAAVGLGFNMMESILYITHMYAIFAPEGQGGVAVFQWYHRQVLGLFMGHTTFTALVGAGIGVARQVPGLAQKLLAVLCGWLAAIAAHFVWDAWYAFFPISQTQFAVLEIHLRTLLMVGPFTAVVVLLVAMALRLEHEALARQLNAEVALGQGTIQPAEVGLLLSSNRRLMARLRAGRRLGREGYLRVKRLQQAQIALAEARWHAERGELEMPEETIAQLREVVSALRRGKVKRLPSTTIRLRPATIQRPIAPAPDVPAAPPASAAATAPLSRGR